MPDKLSILCTTQSGNKMLSPVAPEQFDANKSSEHTSLLVADSIFSDKTELTGTPRICDIYIDHDRVYCLANVEERERERERERV